MNATESKRPDPEWIDEDAPEWTEETFARAKPFAESDLPEDFKQAAQEVTVTLHLNREVVEHFRATGPGWRRRMGQALREWIAEHGRSSPRP